MVKELREWVERALSGVQYGEVILIIHNGEVVRIDRKERRQVNK
jgi:hypothetical protein